MPHLMPLPGLKGVPLPMERSPGVHGLRGLCEDQSSARRAPHDRLDRYRRPRGCRTHSGQPPGPARFQPERDRTAVLIAEHVTGLDEIDESWQDKGKDDVLPLLGDTLDRIGVTIASG